MTVDPEVVVVGVDRDAEGLLRGHVERRVPAIGDTDLSDRSSIEKHCRGHFDVGSMECDHLLVPVVFGELQEDRVEDVTIVESGVLESRNRIDVVGIDPDRIGAGLRSRHLLTTAAARRSATATTLRFGGGLLAGQIPLRPIEPAVLIRIEAIMQEDVLKSRVPTILGMGGRGGREDGGRHGGGGDDLNSPETVDHGVSPRRGSMLVGGMLTESRGRGHRAEGKERNRAVGSILGWCPGCGRGGRLHRPDAYPPPAWS